MKKIIFGLFLLLFIIPTSVQASGVFDFVSLVMPNGEEKTGFWPSQNDSKKSEIASFSATPLSSGARNDVPCDFGSRYDYRRDKCEKVFVPEYGRLNSDGISVSCEMGYILKYGKVQDSGLAGMTIDKCIKVVVPAHAQLSGTGDDFQCDRDFKRVEERCEKLILPANSHIAAGGNDFDCNTGYSKQDGKCVDARKPANAKFFPQSTLPEHAFWVGFNSWDCDSGYVKNYRKLKCDRI